MAKDAIQKAVEAAGGQTALANAIGASQGLVWQWLNHDDATPLNFAPAIERKTGVKCEDLCPEVDWLRDKRGRVTGYRVTVALPKKAAVA